MCSVQPENEEASAFVEALGTELTVDNRLCTKCGHPAVIALRTDDIYCRDCFLVRATHRFRCQFGKSRLIREKEPVLVAYSGGRSSCAMVHLIEEGLSKKAQKKLRFIPELVYVDDDDGSRGSLRQEQEIFFSKLLMQMKETGLKYYIFTLEQVFDNDLCPVVSNDNNATENENGSGAVKKLLSTDRSKLKMLMESTTTETSRESLVFLLRNELLVRFARNLHYGKIVLGDSASCLASRLLSSVVQGRGAQIPCEMGFADDRHGDVTFVRPMREFTEKEIDMYNAIINIRPLVISEPRETAVRSVEILSKQFVSGLQAEHGSTLAIICRTGEKLEMPGDEEITKMDRCVLCQAPTDGFLSSGAASAVDAMTFSHSICHLLQEKTNMKQGSVAVNNDSIKPVTVPEQSTGIDDKTCGNVKNSERYSSSQLLSSLCYGCKLTVREMADVGKLPPSIILKAKEKFGREQMRRNIQEFLLDDENRS